MPLENAQYIQNLNSSYPDPNDDLEQGDEHIRLLKAVLKQTFPNLGGAMTRTHLQLNKAPYDRASMEELLSGGARLTTAQAFFGASSTPNDIAFGWDGTKGRLKARIDNSVTVGGFLTENDWNVIQQQLAALGGGSPITGTPVGSQKVSGFSDAFFLGQINSTTFAILQKTIASFSAGTSTLNITFGYPYKTSPFMVIPMLFVTAGSTAKANLGMYTQVNGQWVQQIHITDATTGGTCNVYSFGYIATNPWA